jgi:hypothetical protein
MNQNAAFFNPEC